MKNQMREAIANFQARRKIYLFAFIVNAVVFGIVNAVSAASTFPELADSYPLGTTFVWSLVLATFLIFGWKQMFYWNLIPLILNIAYALMGAGYEVEETSTYLVEGGWELGAITALIIVGSFFMIGMIMQLISGLRNRREAAKHRVATGNRQMEDDLSDEDYDDEDYDERLYQPIGNDDVRWR